MARPLIRWGLERMLGEAKSRFDVVAAGSSVTESLPVINKLNPDVLLLDFDCEGIGGVRALRAYTRAKLLALAVGTRDQSLLDRAVIAGVSGWVLMEEPPPTLFRAIEKVHQGELWIERAAIGRIFLEMVRQKADQGNADPKIASLTIRERLTIVAVTGDASAPGKVIAERLCISEHSLRNRLTSIYSKLELRNRADLHCLATRNGLDRAP
jgi:DNA-binding NarL/FixJ family response regulator